MINLPKTIKQLFEDVDEYSHIECSIEGEPIYSGDNVDALVYFIDFMKADDYIFEYDSLLKLIFAHDDYDFLVIVDSYGDTTEFNHYYACDKLAYSELDEYKDNIFEEGEF